MAGHQSYQVLRWLEQRKRFQLMEGGGGLQADTTGNQAGIPRTWESVTQCSGAMIVRAQQGPFAWVGALPSTHHQQFRIVAKPREGLPCGEQSPWWYVVSRFSCSTDLSSDCSQPTEHLACLQSAPRFLVECFLLLRQASLLCSNTTAIGHWNNSSSKHHKSSKQHYSQRSTHDDGDEFSNQVTSRNATVSFPLSCQDPSFLEQVDDVEREPDDG